MVQGTVITLLYSPLYLSAVTINHQQKLLKSMAVQTPCCIARATKTIYYVRSIKSCKPSEVTDMNLYKRCSEISYEVTFTLSTCIFFSYSKEFNSYWRYTLIDGWNRGNKDLFKSRENKEDQIWLQMNLRNSCSKTRC